MELHEEQLAVGKESPPRTPFLSQLTCLYPKETSLKLYSLPRLWYN